MLEKIYDYFGQKSETEAGIATFNGSAAKR